MACGGEAAEQTRAVMSAEAVGAGLLDSRHDGDGHLEYEHS